MKKLCTLLFISNLFILSGFAQTPGVQWQINDRNGVGDGTALATSDSGLILSLGNKLSKIDKHGLLEWKVTPVQTIESFKHIRKGADGNYYAFGQSGNFSNTDFYVLKFTGSGTILWEKTFGGSQREELDDVKETADGGWVLGGATYSGDGDVIPPTNHSYDSTKSEVWLIKVSPLGNKVWTKTFGGSEHEHLNRIIGNQTDGFLIACFSNSTDGDFQDFNAYNSAWLLNLDNAGNVIWKKRQANFNTIQDVLKTQGSGYVLLGDTATFGGFTKTNILMAKIDSEGNSIWQKIHDPHNIDYELDARLFQLQDGSFTFLASTETIDTATHQLLDIDVVLYKTDSNGNLLWQKAYNGSQREYATMRLKNNDNLLVNVVTFSADGDFSTGFNQPGNTENEDVWLIEIDPDGNEIYKQVFGGAGDDYAGIEMLNDQMFLIGASNSFGTVSGDYSLWITKVGPANNIKATAYLDNNSNGIKDADEPFTTRATIYATKQGSTIYSQKLSNGVFILSVDTGNYVVNITNTGYYIPNPSTVNSSFSTYFNTDSISFALQPIPNKQDLQVTLFPLTPARPGFAASYQVQYKNVGTTTISSGKVSLVKDTRLNFITSLPTPASITADTLQWGYSNFAPGQTASLQINFTVAAPPASNFGDTLKLLATIYPVAGDETPADDTAILKQRVVGSYDPNDKTERNGGLITPAFISKGEALLYTIRFQNTGTDTAFGVAVRDTLSNKVDVATLEIISASHLYKLEIEDSILIWQFDNILLPDSTTNEAASHGYIVYRIRPKATVFGGEIIHNTASIYFDFNLPVLTNDASTLVKANLAVLPQGLLSFYGNRQEQKVNLFWKVADINGLKKFNIERSIDGINYTQTGSAFAESSRMNYMFTDLSFTASLVIFYRLALIAGDGSYKYSNVLAFHKEGDNAGALVISPNPVMKQSSISFNALKTGKAELQVLTASGNIISRQAIDLTRGLNVFPLIKNYVLVPGIYFLRIISGEVRKTTSFVIK